MSTQTTLEQGRASHAYKFVEEGKQLTKSNEYKSYVKKLPMYIKTNGLGAAMAFVFAKGNKDGKPDPQNAWGKIYLQIDKWLRDERAYLIEFDNNQLVKKLTETDSGTYRAVTVEILALLTWMKRFAEALIEGDDNPSDD